MPRFIAYNVDVDVDVDIEEVLDECSEKEIEKLIKWLIDNEYLNKFGMPAVDLSSSQIDFYSNISKLSELYFTLSKEDYEVIETILKKY
jgi:hypothetical protein